MQLPLSLLVLALAPAGDPVPGSAGEPAAAGPIAAPSVTAVALGVHRDPAPFHAGLEAGRPWLRGRDYKAYGDTEGFHFVPFLGSAAPRNWPLGLRVRGVEVGGRAVALAAPEARLEGHAVVLDRGPVSARYEGTSAAVEQLLVLDGLGDVEGDVVVTVAWSSDLTAAPLGDGLAFDGPDGGVRMGGAVALDGRGGRLPLATELDAEGVRYRVPAAFARAAGAALVIDPVLTTFRAADLGIDVREPDVAYDVDNDTYEVVYTGVFSGTDRDLHYTTVSGASLMAVDSGFVELISGDAHLPRCASVAGDDAFLVAYLENDAFGRTEIYARARGAAPGASWAVTHLVATFDEFRMPVVHDLGGEGYEGPGGRGIVVWEEEARGGGAFGSGIRARLLLPDAQPAAPAVAVAPSLTSIDHRIPAVSKFSGDPIVHGAWWIAHVAGPVGFAGVEVLASRMEFDGTLTEAMLPVATIPGGAQVEVVDVSAPYQTPNVVEAVHFVAQASPGGLPQTHVMTRHRPTVSFDPIVTPIQDQDINDSLVTAMPALATTRDRAGLAYNDRRDLSTNPVLLISTLEHALLQGAAVGERRMALDVLADPAATPIGVTSGPAGGFELAPPRTAYVWSDRTTGDLDIYLGIADLDEPAAVGRNFCRGTLNSRDRYGFLSAHGTNSVLSPKVLRASGLPVNQFGLFVVSNTTGSLVPMGSQGLLCLGGSIGRINASLASSGSGGDMEYSVNPTAIPQGSGTVAAMAGQTWSFQLWHRDVNPTATSNFTSGVQIDF